MRKHIHRHIFRHHNKIQHHLCNTRHSFAHLGEFILVGAFGFMSLIFASSSNLPNNTSFSYPLRQVSTLECRTLYRNEMPESCKINLPRIHGGNYSAYQDNELYRSIYTVLWAASYSEPWNQKVGAHAGVDIATARGTPLYSIGDGEVYSAGRNSAYGNLVRIKYVYNGQIVYAVYAHMDTITVKAGDRVSRGQRIGTVGNSGNTFGALGGYHVHFEIVKDNFGRPAYAYTNCPDLSKGHYRIIQDGLCRTELVTYQYDPIRILEAGSQYVPPVQETSPNTGVGESGDNDSLTPDNNITNPDQNKPPKQNDGEKEKSEPENQHPSGEQNTGSINPGNQNPIVENPQEDNSLQTPPSDNKDNISQNDPLLIDLDFSGLRNLAEHFSRLWDVEMRSKLKQKNLMLGQTETIDIEVFRKGTHLNKDGNYYDGVLRVPFMFLSNNDVVSVNINSLQLITKGKAQIEITGNKIGKSTLVIKLDGKRIGSLDVVVR